MNLHIPEQVSDPIDPEQIPCEQVLEPIEPEQIPCEQVLEPIEPEQIPCDQVLEPIEPEQIPCEQVLEPIEPEQTPCEPPDQIQEINVTREPVVVVKEEIEEVRKYFDEEARLRRSGRRFMCTVQ